MKCHDLELRLYDEDCRDALLGRGPTPADVVRHRDRCHDCLALWSETQAVAEGLRNTLVSSLSPTARDSLYGIATRSPRSSAAFDPHLASRALALGAIAAAFSGAVLSAPSAWQAAIFILVTGWGYSLGWADRLGLRAELARILLPLRLVSWLPGQ